MTEIEKQQRLKKYKAIATGLFVLMAVVFVGTHFLFVETVLNGYVRAFSEAAMVGALADWFAVTALFKHPMGIPIPHTDLIERNRGRIGDNLGNFVVENFLNAESIRPRLRKLQVAKRLGEWLLILENRKKATQEIVRIATDALNHLDDQQIQTLIQEQGSRLIRQMNTGEIAGKTLNGILNSGVHQDWISLLSKNISTYIAQHPELIEEKVRKESHILIPDFVDDYIAKKIRMGLQNFLQEIIDNPNHAQRKQITQRLRSLAEEMKTTPQWEQRFEQLKGNLFPESKIESYAKQIWLYLKDYLQRNLETPNSKIHQYLNQILEQTGQSFQQDEARAKAIDAFVQFQAYKLFLRNREQVGQLISHTIEGWKGHSLSHKLELEVGKDLQFIRLNGTIVGGLVGLLLYVTTQFFLK